MPVAVRVPKQKGKCVRSIETIQLSEVSKQRDSNARTVIECCEQYVPLVIDGSMGLDGAYRDANRERMAR